MSFDDETLLETDRFRVVRVGESGGQSGGNTREVIRHPGAVTILPMVDDDHVCLIKNHRVAVNETLIELPAGTLEISEPPEEAASRELAEETGFRANRLELLHSFFLSPGIIDERMHLFLATELTPGVPDREPGEQIENLVVRWSDAVAMIHDHKIHDAKTIIGLLYYEQFQVRR